MHSITESLFARLGKYTCTVALGIQARTMKTFSFRLKPARSTTTKVISRRTVSAMNRAAIPRTVDRIHYS